jgi:hypothetical protein
MVEKGEWLEFVAFALSKYVKVQTVTGYEMFVDWLIHPDRCKTVAEWLRGREK